MRVRVDYGRWVLALLLAAVLSACRGSGGALAPAPGSPDPLDAFLPQRAKIFLVAGGHDSANFAQEIVDQRQIWRQAGFDDDEIVCYWAKPTPRALAADRAQYRALVDELRTCHTAEPRVLRRHLEVVAHRHATQAEVPFVYLYITSHGSRSVLAEAEESKRSSVRELAGAATPCERRLLDRAAMVLAGNRPGALHFPSILSAVRDGATLDELVLTPTSLRDAMTGLGHEVPKIVVLQGCYTGSFIGTEGDPRSLDGLATLPNLTLITAARHDRASFGCQPGSDRTEFGRAFNQVLASTRGLDHPPRVSWRGVYRRTRSIVEEREAQLYGGRSQPQFVRSTRKTPTGPTDELERCSTPAE